MSISISAGVGDLSCFPTFFYDPKSNLKFLIPLEHSINNLKHYLAHAIQTIKHLMLGLDAIKALCFASCFIICIYIYIALMAILHVTIVLYVL